MPEAEEGNRTEDGKIVQVRSNVASANKWCKCGQMARRKGCCLCGQWLQVLTNGAYTHTHTHTTPLRPALLIQTVEIEPFDAKS